MRLIDADTAQPGMTITALQQTAGKGQRGRKWEAASGESLIMSIIIFPELKLEQQFMLSAATAVAVAAALEEIIQEHEVHIKWPNDIMIGDKKAGGILIENVLRGSTWVYAVLGIGINILQTDISHLPKATSLKKITGKNYDLITVRETIRATLFKTLDNLHENEIIKQYNERLYKKDKQQFFTDGNSQWEVQVIKALSDGRLNIIEENGEENFYTHGFQNWVY